MDNIWQISQKQMSMILSKTLDRRTAVLTLVKGGSVLARLVDAESVHTVFL